MASRVVTRHYDRALAAAGVTTSGYSILARTQREGPLPLGALAARLAMDRTTLSRELGPLREAGLLTVSADEHDRRKKIVALSKRGVTAVEHARPLWARAQDELADEFGPSRTQELVSELHALIGAS
jgi:DNA-binding MarR family transcriptional regulator